MLTVGSLFSGIGGIEYGLEKTGGFKTIWFIESNSYCQEILQKHWPGVLCYEDIRKVDFSKLKKPDILTGGFPCQDISVAGKGAGITGKKSGLWKEYARAIGEIRPKYALIENVSALLNRGLDTVLCDIASLGYDAEWHCLPASAIGAPHRRDRIFIIAVENSECLGWKKGGTEGDNRGTEKKECPDFAGETGSDVVGSNVPVMERCIKKRSGEWQPEMQAGSGSPDISDSGYINYWKQCKESLCKKNRKETWATDAGILRVAHGIPNRVDRIKAVGNAVVPQVAEFFGKMIMEKERKEES